MHCHRTRRPFVLQAVISLLVTACFVGDGAAAAEAPPTCAEVRDFARWRSWARRQVNIVGIDQNGGNSVYVLQPLALPLARSRSLTLSL